MQRNGTVRHAVVWIAGLACLPVAATADQVWTANGGQTKFTFDQGRLANLGLSLTLSENGTSSQPDGSFSLAITPSSSFTVRTAQMGIEAYQGGQIEHDGIITIAAGKEEVHLKRFAIRHGDDGTGAALVIVPGRNDGEGALLRAFDSKIGFDVVGGLLQAEVARVEISEDLATLLGNGDLAGQTIGEMFIVADLALISGDPPVREPKDGSEEDENLRICNPAVHGPDIIVGTLDSVCNFTAEEVTPGVWVDAFSVGTVSCNMGDVICQWVSSTQWHPVIAQNMYRLKSGRFEQLGQSWLKHGFLALSGSVCCTCNGGGGSFLDLGCSDPYGCGLNGGQPSAGSKSEVNAFNGVFPYPVVLNPPYSGDIARRCQVRSVDLDPALNAGALYFVSGHYVSQDDALAGNNKNNKSWAQVTISGTGHEFASSQPGVTHRAENALRAWVANDTGVQLAEVNVLNEGHFLVATKATDLGNGTWSYEYAVENNTSDRSMASFTVPIAGGVTVTNIGFHDVFYHSGIPFEGTDWPGVYESNYVRWVCPNAVNTNANALRWGNVYNFRFDANVPPHRENGELVNGTIVLGLFKPGTPTETTTLMQVPQQGPPDCDHDALPDACELDCGAVTFDGACAGLPGCGGSVDCNSDAVPDDCQADCNGNGTPDDCDLTAGTSLDGNANGLPDECQTLKVKGSAAAGGHGSSWDGALNSLAEALQLAADSDGRITEIWVGPGVYKPSTAGLSSPRTARFGLIDDLGIYGGFDGDETERTQRNPKAGTAVLSGDLNSNDGADFAGNSDNAYHVVVASGKGPTAVLDGFIITGGNTVGSPATEIYGAGIYVNNGNPTLRNLTVTRNRATWGGGIYITGLTAFPNLVNCMFIGNHATSVGGGAGVVQTNNPTFVNCVFAGNYASNGGAVFSNTASPKFINCTIMGNHASSNGGGLRLAGSGMTPIVANSIVWYNTLGVGGLMTEAAQISVVTGCFPQVNESTIQGLTGNLGGTGNTSDDPQVTEIPANGGDGWGVGGNDDFGDLHLTPGSPCVDAGDNGRLPAGIVTDLDENARIVNDIVDVGAYERQAAVATGACCTNGACSDGATADACQAFVCNVADHLPPTFTGCYGDANGDGFVTPSDRGFVAVNIGTTDPALMCTFDIDGNGFVTPGDRGFIAVNIGLCTPLPDFQNGSGMNHGVPEARFGTATFTAGGSCATVTCE